MSAVAELKALIPEAQAADLAEPPLVAAEGGDYSPDDFNPDNLPSVADEAQQAQMRAMVQMLLDVGFGVLAPNWGVESNETEQLTDALIPVLDKYMPNVAGNIGPEFVLLSAVALVAAPRIQQGVPLRVEKEVNPRNESEQPAAPVRPEPPQDVPTHINLD